MSVPPEYDPRYLAGIVHFNRREFFEAHEVWEDLWRECAAEPRRFYQGLIQAAVAVYHGGNGNGRGARRLFESGRKYMSVYPNPYLGLDWVEFWQRMEAGFAEIPNEAEARLDDTRIGAIRLSPAPSAWPDPSPSLSDD